MAQGTKICKICGKEYPYCKTEVNRSTFRYQDVACCPEHASEYFAKIAMSRSKANMLPEEPKDAKKMDEPIVDISEEFDPMDFLDDEDEEDEFDDEDEDDDEFDL